MAEPKPAPKSLTDRIVENLPFCMPPKREYYVSDVGRDRVPGLILRIGKTTKAWVFQSEERKGSKRRLVYKALGRFPAVKVDDARAAAKLLDAAKTNNQYIPNKKDSKTLAVAWEEYAQSLQDRGTSATWPREVRGYYNRNFKSIGHRRLPSLSASVPGVTEELREMFLQTTERGPYEANRAFKLLNIVYNHARAYNMQLPPDAPCAAFGKLKLWHEELAAEEECIPKDKLAAWAAAVDKVERERNPLRAALHRLCVLVGNRPGELARLRWEDVDWQNRLFYLRKTKSRKKKAAPPIIIPMTARIAQQLNLSRKAGAVMHPNSPFVFPGHGKAGHLVNWKKDKDILEYWGKSGRHTYLTYAATLPVSNVAVRKMTGHRDKNDPHEFNYQDVRQQADGLLRPAQRVISKWLWSQMYPPQKEAAPAKAA